MKKSHGLDNFLWQAYNYTFYNYLIETERFFKNNYQSQ